MILPTARHFHQYLSIFDYKFFHPLFSLEVSILCYISSQTMTFFVIDKKVEMYFIAKQILKI